MIMVFPQATPTLSGVNTESRMFSAGPPRAFAISGFDEDERVCRGFRIRRGAPNLNPNTSDD